MSEVRLDEMNKVEWFDVARVFNRDLTWDEFCRDWDEFQAMKVQRTAN